MARSVLLEFRRGTAAAWTAANPTLAAGEPGWETDTDLLKIGDGATAWNALAYFAAAGSGITGLASPGGTITVTNPAGPTADVDLPATGVTAATYGDGSHTPTITVDAEGRITAAADTAIAGGSGTIGFEVGYDQITSGVNITGTTEATGTTIITSGPHSYDGSPVLLVFFAPQVNPPTAGATNTVVFTLFEGATELGKIAVVRTVATAATNIRDVTGQYRFTPSAGNHTYTLQAFVSSTTGSPSVSAGSGGTAAFLPAFVRVTKV